MSFEAAAAIASYSWVAGSEDLEDAFAQPDAFWPAWRVSVGGETNCNNSDAAIIHRLSDAAERLIDIVVGHHLYPAAGSIGAEEVVQIDVHDPRPTFQPEIDVFRQFVWCRFKLRFEPWTITVLMGYETKCS